MSEYERLYGDSPISPDDPRLPPGTDWSTISEPARRIQVTFTDAQVRALIEAARDLPLPTDDG